MNANQLINDFFDASNWVGLPEVSRCWICRDNQLEFCCCCLEFDFSIYFHELWWLDNRPFFMNWASFSYIFSKNSSRFTICRLRCRFHDVIQNLIAISYAVYGMRKSNVQWNTNRRYDKVWNLENELWIKGIYCGWKEKWGKKMG